MRQFLILLLFITTTASHGGVDSFITVGDEIEHSYQKHAEILGQYYAKLKATLKEKQPELLKKLSPVPPKALVPGYQLLPEITDEKAVRGKNEPNFSTVIFSWPKTRAFLVDEIQKLEGQTQALVAGKNLKYENLVENYRRLDDNQTLIGSHIQYNRLWQREIVLYREKYDANNKLYENLVSKSVEPEKIAAKILKELMSEPSKPIQLKNISESHKVIEVNMVTDIEDRAFVEKFIQAVKKFWHIQGDVEYEVDLKIKSITPQELYAPGPPPKKGDSIDISKHVAHFPEGVIALTTGTGTSYYSFDHIPFVTIGVTGVSDHVLAHEFGHVLTINDGYFRAYKELKNQGYEIIEVIPDYTDIMVAPSYGVAKKHHFETVIEALEKRKN